MPSYNAATPRAIYPGNEIALVNSAATDSSVTTTQQCSMGPDPGGQTALILTNTTNQTATVQIAPSDTPSLYQPYTYLGSAITAAANTSVGFPIVPGVWLRCTFSTAPSSGSLILSR